ATSSGVGWTAQPSGALHEVTADDNDATYAEWSGSGSAMILATPLAAPPVGERRHLVRIRARGEGGWAWWAVRLATGQLRPGDGRRPPLALPPAGTGTGWPIRPRPESGALASSAGRLYIV